MGTQPITLVATASIAASLPANQYTPVTLQLDPSVAGVQQQQVPISEAWVIDDVFVSSAPTPDGVVQFSRNLKEVLIRTPPVSSLVVSNPSRPRVQKKVYQSGDIITLAYQNLAANGASAVTITFYVSVMRFFK